MRFTISETAKLAGVSVRTLHYYDKIGLLAPSEVISDTGYRYYNEEAVERLQQILFYRELDFPLREITNIMNADGYNKKEALEHQRELLVLKRKRMDKLIDLLDDNLKGANSMSFQEFDMTEIEEVKRRYADEAKEKWGNTNAYQESMEKQKGYSKEQWIRMMERQNEIFGKLSAHRNEAPESREVQGIVKEWQDYITEYYYNCTNKILGRLGVMYTADERFKNNIDKAGEGTAELLSEAIKVYCEG